MARFVLSDGLPPHLERVQLCLRSPAGLCSVLGSALAGAWHDPDGVLAPDSFRLLFPRVVAARGSHCCRRCAHLIRVDVVVGLLDARRPESAVVTCVALGFLMVVHPPGAFGS